MEYICEFYTSPGFTNEKLYLFLATGLKAGESHPENDEYIDVLKFKLDNLVDMVWKGQILDSKTIIGAFAVSSYLQNKR
jgi:ADP-ribose pyrophosphatase